MHTASLPRLAASFSLPELSTSLQENPPQSARSTASANLTISGAPDAPHTPRKPPYPQTSSLRPIHNPVRAANHSSPPTIPALPEFRVSISVSLRQSFLSVPPSL